MCRRCHKGLIRRCALPKRGVCRGRRRPASPGARRGLTLIELLIAMSIILMVLGTLQAVGHGVNEAFLYNEGHGQATQHARVALERIARTAGEAAANEQFPGFIVVADQVGSLSFPDTLVVWRPAAAPATPTGLPRFNELVVYCPAQDAPGTLLEITVPDDARTVPAAEDRVAWAKEVAAIKTSASAKKVVLTGLLRTCSISAGSAPRGAVRFAARLRPSQSDWNQYKAGTLAWSRLPWVQGIYGAQAGLRQSWLRMEIQLIPGEDSANAKTAVREPIPFFGSAALYYEMRQ